MSEQLPRPEHGTADPHLAPPPGAEQYVDANNLDTLSQLVGVPCVSFLVPTNMTSRITVLDSRRQLRAWGRVQRRRARAKRRAFRRQYPWHVRYPALGHVVFWSMILIGLFLLIKAP